MSTEDTDKFDQDEEDEKLKHLLTLEQMLDLRRWNH